MMHDAESSFDLRLELERSSGSATPPPSAERHDSLTRVPRIVGPWILRRKRGEFDWTPDPAVNIHAGHAWKVKPHSSRRTGPDLLRILLLGSSAAGSFGYWETFSLAEAIRFKVQSAQPRRSVEVVDLAAINATWEEANVTLAAGATLRPDAVVIFAGNNECKQSLRRLEEEGHPGASSTDLRWALLEDPAKGLEALEEFTGARLRTDIRRSKEICSAFEIPLFVAIPPINMADWRGPERLPFHLTGPELSQWLELLRRARETLAAGKPAAARKALDAALKLDGGFCQATWQASSEHRLATGGDRKLVSGDLRRARDGGLGPFVRSVPQVTLRMEQAIREECKQLGLPAIDLASQFKARGSVPGREHFLDYCHLSANGIDRAADSIARVLLTGIGLEVGRRAPAVLKSLVPNAHDEARACMVAAIHNFHYAQPSEICVYWWTKCLKASARMRPVLEFLFGVAASSMRERITVEHLRGMGLESLLGSRHFYFFCKYLYHERFDVQMVRDLGCVLGKTPAAVDHSIAAQSATLLMHEEPELCTLHLMDRGLGFEPCHRSGARTGWERPWNDFVATESLSVVEFPARKDCRTIAIDATGVVRNSVSLSLNGYKLGEYSIREGSQVLQIPVSAQQFATPINRLEFSWDRLATVYDAPTKAQRAWRVATLGWYPVAARLHSIKLLKEGKEDAAR